MGVRHGVAVAGVCEALWYPETEVPWASNTSAGGVCAVFLEEELGNRRNDFQEVSDGVRGNVCESWRSVALAEEDIPADSVCRAVGVEDMELRREGRKRKRVC